jgi:hypothetical protein
MFVSMGPSSSLSPFESSGIGVDGSDSISPQLLRKGGPQRKGFPSQLLSSKVPNWSFCSKLSTFANCQHFLNHPIHYQPPSPLQPLYLCFPFSCKLIEDRREERESAGREKVLSVQEASVQRKKRECNCESECKCRFERKECKSETLVFVGCIGLSWVFVSFLH